jgi:hypothetical protein
MEQRSRSGLYRSGQRRAKQAARQADAQSNPQQDPRKDMETVPHVGEPQDGSQFQNVVEEQSWADQPPSPEEEQRRATSFDKTR